MPPPGSFDGAAAPADFPAGLSAFFSAPLSSSFGFSATGGGGIDFAKSMRP